MPKQIAGEMMLTKREVAAALHVSPQTVQRYIDQQKIEAFLIGGKWWVKEATLQAYIAGSSNIQDGSKKLPNIAA